MNSKWKFFRYFSNVQHYVPSCLCSMPLCRLSSFCGLCWTWGSKIQCSNVSYPLLWCLKAESFCNIPFCSNITADVCTMIIRGWPLTCDTTPVPQLKLHPRLLVPRARSPQRAPVSRSPGDLLTQSVHLIPHWRSVIGHHR